MTLQDVGAIGELIGAVAVVFSLLYLAAQIRLNTRHMEEQSKALQLASLNAVEESFSRFRIPIMSDSELASLWSLVREDYNAIPDSQKAQADMMLWEYFYCWANFMTRLESEIASTPDAKERLRRNLIANVRKSPGVAPWWVESRDAFRASFAEIVDEALREPESK